jgi:hypothetical protein
VANDGDLVYAEMQTSNEELLLGGDGSEWLWSGGSADRWGVLYAYGWKDGVEIDTRARVGRLPRLGPS